MRGWVFRRRKRSRSYQHTQSIATTGEEGDADATLPSRSARKLVERLFLLAVVTLPYNVSGDVGEVVIQIAFVSIIAVEISPRIVILILVHPIIY